jgi:hypothetical protein
MLNFILNRKKSYFGEAKLIDISSFNVILTIDSVLSLFALVFPTIIVCDELDPFVVREIKA